MLPASWPVTLVYQSHRPVASKLRAFLDFAALRLKARVARNAVAEARLRVTMKPHLPGFPPAANGSHGTPCSPILWRGTQILAAFATRASQSRRCMRPLGQSDRRREELTIGPTSLIMCASKCPPTKRVCALLGLPL